MPVLPRSGPEFLFGKWTQSRACLHATPGGAAGRGAKRHKTVTGRLYVILAASSLPLLSGHGSRGCTLLGDMSDFRSSRAAVGGGLLRGIRFPESLVRRSSSVIFRSAGDETGPCGSAGVPRLSGRFSAGQSSGAGCRSCRLRTPKTGCTAAAGELRTEVRDFWRPPPCRPFAVWRGIGRSGGVSRLRPVFGGIRLLMARSGKTGIFPCGIPPFCLRSNSRYSVAAAPDVSAAARSPASGRMTTCTRLPSSRIFRATACTSDGVRSRMACSYCPG